MTTPQASYMEQDAALRHHVRKGDRVRSRLTGWVGTVQLLTSRGNRASYVAAVVVWDARCVATRSWVGDLELLAPGAGT
jgi:hypothetical protein